MSLRLAVAGTPVLDETTARGVLDGDTAHVDDATKAALDFADVLMTQPGELDDALARRLHQHFTDGQLAELTVKVLKFNRQKITVACGHDEVMTAEEMATKSWAADGSFVAAPGS